VDVRAILSAVGRFLRQPASARERRYFALGGASVVASSLWRGWANQDPWEVLWGLVWTAFSIHQLYLARKSSKIPS